VAFSPSATRVAIASETDLTSGGGYAERKSVTDDAAGG
jgi:hypothetical protein